MWCLFGKCSAIDVRKTESQLKRHWRNEIVWRVSNKHSRSIGCFNRKKATVANQCIGMICQCCWSARCLRLFLWASQTKWGGKMQVFWTIFNSLKRVHMRQYNVRVEWWIRLSLFVVLPFQKNSTNTNVIVALVCFWFDTNYRSKFIYTDH